MQFWSSFQAALRLFPDRHLPDRWEPGLDTNTDHSLDILMFPDLQRDINIPQPVHRDMIGEKT